MTKALGAGTQANKGTGTTPVKSGYKHFSGLVCSHRLVRPGDIWVILNTTRHSKIICFGGIRECKGIIQLKET